MAYRRGNYYYRSRREGRRVITKYLGSGELGSLIAFLEEEEQEERREARQLVKEEKEVQRKLNRQINNLTAQIRGIIRAVLLAEGFHTHKGQWRRIRHGRKQAR